MKIILSFKKTALLPVKGIKGYFFSREQAKDFFKAKKLANKQIYSEVVRLEQFTGKDGEFLTLFGTRENETTLLIGLGEDKKITKHKIRDAAARALRFVKKMKAEFLTVEIPEVEKGRISSTAIVEEMSAGFLLGNYEYTVKSKTENYHKKLKSVTICGLKKNYNEILKNTEKLCASVNFARELVNGNSDDLHPEALIREAKQLSKKAKCPVKIIKGNELKKRGLNLIHSVGKGASNLPSLIMMEYLKGGSKKPKIVIVGKGVTFDSGGLNLKTSGHIETMKQDMAGAAAVLGAMKAISELNLKVNVIGVLGCAENAIGSKAYKPGDIIKSYQGKTVEVSNTDAEGRLILADAISYAEKKYKPDYIIDLATLTGAALVALGTHYSALLTEDDELRTKIKAAADGTGEKVWELPLTDPYMNDMKSEIADVRNMGKDKNAGTIRGAVFLKEFVNKAKWAHLDIAGTAYAGEVKGAVPKFGTGYGVRLLTELITKI